MAAGAASYGTDGESRMRSHKLRNESFDPPSPLTQLTAPTTLTPYLSWRVPGDALWTMDESGSRAGLWITINGCRHYEFATLL
jgi:hypothetical protein